MQCHDLHAAASPTTNAKEQSISLRCLWFIFFSFDDDWEQKATLGPWWCGQVVSMLAFYSDDSSLNPAETYSFPVKSVFEKK